MSVLSVHLKSRLFLIKNQDQVGFVSGINYVDIQAIRNKKWVSEAEISYFKGGAGGWEARCYIGYGKKNYTIALSRLAL